MAGGAYISSIAYLYFTEDIKIWDHGSRHVTTAVCMEIDIASYLTIITYRDKIWLGAPFSCVNETFFPNSYTYMTCILFIG